jgi:hypothetical protein
MPVNGVRFIESVGDWKTVAFSTNHNFLRWINSGWTRVF